MSAGLLLVIAGVWVGTQVLGGNALGRLKLVSSGDLVDQAASGAIKNGISGLGNPIGIGLPAPN